MSKADKSTAMQRTQDVLKLLLAGGEFAEIRQYASARGWNLSDRQLRRYQERAYKRLAAVTRRDQEQLLGRHLMQRRALYARALKNSDIRTALQVLRDEAALEGLYPPTKIAPTTPDGQQPYYAGSAGPPLSREERFRRLLAAEERQDKGELRLLEQATPLVYFRLPDTMMPLMLLNLCALLYIADQLDHAGMVFVGLWEAVTGGDEHGNWDIISKCHAYRFRVEVDAWDLFTESLGIDSQDLLLANHRGSLLELIGDRVYEIAPTTDELTCTLEAAGQSAASFPTPEKVAEDWQDLLSKILGK